MPFSVHPKLYPGANTINAADSMQGYVYVILGKISSVQ